MSTKNETRMSCLRPVVAMCAVASLSGCMLQNQSPPDPAGPSGLGLTLVMTASPAVLPRDGSSQTTVTVVARDASGTAMPGLSFVLRTNPPVPVVQLDGATGPDGTARVLLTAPTLDVVAPEDNNLVLRIEPLGEPINHDFLNRWPRAVAVGLLGPRNATYPSPDFTASPDSPKAGGTVVFDASPSTDEGQPCVTCSFTWVVNGVTSTGRIAQTVFPAEGAYPVELTVTDITGTSFTRTKVVQIAPADDDMP